jgi:perosamine synthetase
MKIQLCRPSISKKDMQVVNKSLKSGWLTHGPENLKFEKNFNKLLNSNYAISMNSCTSALECAIKCLKKKGEIIVPSFTWVSSANAIINTGCKPVFVDIDLNSRNIDPNKLEKNISRSTIAIMVVHFSGLPCDMDPILRISRKYNIPVIEDSAETLGAKYKGNFTGTFGLGCFSFFPTKNITTTEGGMLTLKKKSMYENAKKLIAHGIKKERKYFWQRESSLAGHNYRLPNHLAALGASQLKKLKKFNYERNKIAKIYNQNLAKYSDFITVQKIPKNCTHSYQMYTIRVIKKLRNSFIFYLKSREIEASAHFDPPLHKQKLFKKYKKDNLNNTEILSSEIVTLPMFPGLTKKEINYILKVINDWYLKQKK